MLILRKCTYSYSFIHKVILFKQYSELNCTNPIVTYSFAKGGSMAMKELVQLFPLSQ